MRQNLVRCAQRVLWVSAVIFGVSGLSVMAEEAVPASPVVVTEEAAPTTPAVVSESAPVAEFVGAEACAACHSDVVESFKGARHGKMLPKHKGIEFEKSCEACHGPGSLHAGAAGDKSDPGFKTIKLFKKLDTAAISNACMACHKDADRTHWSGSSHDRANVSCLSCHSLHNAKGHGDLVAKNTSETCYVCHKDVKAQMRRSAHMPVEEGKMDCNSCHSPHGTSTPKLLNASNTNQLCFQCHQDKRGPHLWEHQPVRENCLNCHHPHGSHHEKMLTAKRAYLCQRCHTGAQHPGTIYDTTSIGQFNNKIAGQTCQECHSNIHGSNHPSGKMFTR
jgi:DmsE family decaheme c-type cytochrome